jgi:hypothetical protein
MPPAISLPFCRCQFAAPPAASSFRDYFDYFFRIFEAELSFAAILFASDAASHFDIAFSVYFRFQASHAIISPRAALSTLAILII